MAVQTQSAGPFGISNKVTPWGDLSNLGGPPREYAGLDPNAKAEIDRSVALGGQSPQALSDSQIGDLGASQSLLNRPGSNDLRLGMGGNDAFNQAIQERSAKVYSADINRLKNQNLQSAYGQEADRNQEAVHQAQTSNAIEMGAYQKRMEYDQNRRTLRQNIINGVMGTGGKIAGTIMGGMAGSAAAKQPEQQSPNGQQSSFADQGYWSKNPYSQGNA